MVLLTVTCRNGGVMVAHAQRRRLWPRGYWLPLLATGFCTSALSFLSATRLQLQIFRLYIQLCWALFHIYMLQAFWTSTCLKPLAHLHESSQEQLGRTSSVNGVV